MTDEIEAAKARAVFVAMVAAVDLRDWAHISSAFARQIAIDYSSLFSGKPETVSNKELVGRWKALLPGFDATRHVLTDVEVLVNGDTAEGRARVEGTHYLDGRSWTPAGRYLFRLEKRTGEWKITALTYQHEREDGERGLVERAAARAANL